MTRFAIALAVLSFAAVGCNKDEKKDAPPGPDNTKAQTAPGQGAAVQAGQGGTQVQAGNAKVQVGQGGTTVQAGGVTVQTGAGGAQVNAGGGAVVAAQPGQQPVVMQNGQNQLKVDGTKVEAKTGDGRQAVVQGDTVKLKGADGKTVEVKGGTVNANGVKIENGKVIVPGVGAVPAQ